MKHTKHWKCLKYSAIIFWSLFLLVVVIINIGCTKEIIIERNITINKTIYKNNTIIIDNTVPCNLTCPKINTTYDRSYVLSLIRQLKHYEKQQDDYYNYNDTNCFYDLNRTTNELNDCKEELCEYNTNSC